MITREQKMEWLEKATNEQLIKQFITSVEQHYESVGEKGIFDKQTREYADDVVLIKSFLLMRLST